MMNGFGMRMTAFLGNLVWNVVNGDRASSNLVGGMDAINHNVCFPNSAFAASSSKQMISFLKERSLKNLYFFHYLFLLL